MRVFARTTALLWWPTIAEQLTHVCFVTRSRSLMYETDNHHLHTESEQATDHVAIRERSENPRAIKISLAHRGHDRRTRPHQLSSFSMDKLMMHERNGASLLFAVVANTHTSSSSSRLQDIVRRACNLLMPRILRKPPARHTNGCRLLPSAHLIAKL